MEELTVLFLILTIGLFLVRYALKKNGVNYLAAVMGICTLVVVLKDHSIAEDYLLIVLLPVVLIVFLTLTNLMFGGRYPNF